jgi:hypothetical protein
MKKKMKQFLAAMMAVAMVLSLCVTAGATGTPQTSVSGDDAAYTLSGGTVKSLPMSGGFKGTSISEGPLPEDPVEVIFPTIPNNPGRNDGVSKYSGDTFGVFDIILDPHSLIKATDGARYATTDGPKKSFSDSRLYFLKNFTDDFQRYDGESYPLKITNKGRQPINIDLNLDFKYDATKMVLVDTEGDLNIASGDPFNPSSKGAEIYFALKYGTVISGDDSTITGDTIVSGDVKAVKKVADSEAPVLVKVSGRGDYLTSNGVTFTWGTSTTSGADYDALNKDLSKVSVKLSYEKANPIISGDAIDNGKIKLEVKAPSAYTTTLSGGTISGDLVSGGAITGADLVTLSIKSGGNEIATVAMDLVAPNAQTMKESTTSGDFSQVIQFKAATTGTHAQVMLDGNLNAYKKQWKNPDGTDATEAQGITDSGYYWKLQEDENSKFPTLSFSLEGNINDDHVWDSVKPRDTKVEFNLVWDVMQHSTYYTSIASGGQLEKVAPADVAPTVKVKTPATSSQQLVLEWTPGKGAYADYVPGTSLKVGSKNITLTKNDTAKTLTASGTANTNYTTYANATTKGTITFTATGKAAYPVEITGMR